MSVVTVPVTLNVPKETKEVIDLLAALVDEVKKSGKNLAGYAGLIDELYAAIDGVDKLSEEFKSEHKGASIAYLAKTVGEKI